MEISSDTIYKLMILYMMNRLDSQLTNSQVSSFFIEKGYADYFVVQKTLNDLVASNFTEVVTIRNTSYYSITPDGYETLTYFKDQIPKGAIEDIDAYLEENKYALKNEIGTQADYYKHTNGDFIAHCRVMEGKSLLYEINIAVPSEEEAEHICRNWNGYSEDLYGYIIKTLFQ